LRRAVRVIEFIPEENKFCLTVQDGDLRTKSYGSFPSAWSTLEGIETANMICEGRVKWVTKGDVGRTSAIRCEAVRNRTAETDASGSYRFSLLPPGEYSLRFTAQGFKTLVPPAVKVAVTEIATLNV
jgi:hypothetical protein